jgi:hypothetical protein
MKIFRYATFLILATSSFSAFGHDTAFNLGVAKAAGIAALVLRQADEDFRFVIAGKKPIHAKFQLGVADGGSSIWKGDGYTITIVKSLAVVGGIDGNMYGPVINFDYPTPPRTPRERAERERAQQNEPRISHVMFYSQDALDKLLK